MTHIPEGIYFTALDVSEVLGISYDSTRELLRDFPASRCVQFKDGTCVYPERTVRMIKKLYARKILSSTYPRPDRQPMPYHLRLSTVCKRFGLPDTTILKLCAVRCIAVIEKNEVLFIPRSARPVLIEAFWDILAKQP